MATHEKKQSKSLTEKTKKCECEICGRKMRITRSKENVCDSCRKVYGIKK